MARATDLEAGHELVLRLVLVTTPAQGLKHARYALWKNPENLTVKQQTKLTWIVCTDPRLHPAYLLKEGLRTVFVPKGEEGKEALDRWINEAHPRRIPAFVTLHKPIVKHRDAINAALDPELSNTLAESTNTKIRLITRAALGFHNPNALIAPAIPSLRSHPPAHPDRK